MLSRSMLHCLSGKPLLFSAPTKALATGGSSPGNLSRPFKKEMIQSHNLNVQGRLTVVKYPDPRLRAKNRRISVFDSNLVKLVDEMFNVMYDTDGIGLAAPQVGVNAQVLVFNPTGKHVKGDEIVLINPMIERFSRKIIAFNEGCLSFPGVYADVRRPGSVKVAANNTTGARFIMSLSGLPARILQHEFDHLQGILFTDRMANEVLHELYPAIQALEKKYETEIGKPSPESVRHH